MKARIIHTKFWTDGYISSLNRAEKMAFIYLLTNEHIGLSGIYELPDNIFAFECGLSLTEIEEIKKKFISDNKFNFYKGWVKVCNTDKYQNFSGEKNDIAREKEIKLINTDILDTLSIPYRYPIDTHGIPLIINNQYSVTSNKKSIKNNINTNNNSEDFKNFILELKDNPEFNGKNIDGELKKFKDYLLAKGKKYKDYKAGFRNWLRNTDTFTPYNKKDTKGDNERMLEKLNATRS